MHNENLQTSSSNHPRKPVLPLILCSRNDQYQGNSPLRLETALNYVAQNVYELGRKEDVEVIVADWGSETPLRGVLQLTPAAAKIPLELPLKPSSNGFSPWMRFSMKLLSQDAHGDV